MRTRKFTSTLSLFSINNYLRSFSRNWTVWKLDVIETPRPLLRGACKTRPSLLYTLERFHMIKNRFHAHSLKEIEYRWETISQNFFSLFSRVQKPIYKFWLSEFFSHDCCLELESTRVQRQPNDVFFVLFRTESRWVVICKCFSYQLRWSQKSFIFNLKNQRICRYNSAARREKDIFSCSNRRWCIYVTIFWEWKSKNPKLITKNDSVPIKLITAKQLQNRPWHI